MNIVAAVKAVAALVICALLFFGGMSCGKASSREEIAEKRQALQTASQQLSNAAQSLRDVNIVAERAKAAAVEQQTRADQAVDDASKDAKAYEKRIDSIAVELEKAKRHGTCRAQLEQPLCADLQ